MKQLFIFFVFLFIITLECNAACVSGDCTNGHGTFIKDNGNKYEGQFKNGLQNGEGTFIFTNGNKYIGQWKDGKRHGHGIFTTTGGSKYDGQWENNYRKGAGTFTKVNEKGSSLCLAQLKAERVKQRLDPFYFYKQIAWSDPGDGRLGFAAGASH